MRSQQSNQKSLQVKKSPATTGVSLVQDYINLTNKEKIQFKSQLSQDDRKAFELSWKAVRNLAAKNKSSLLENSKLRKSEKSQKSVDSYSSDDSRPRPERPYIQVVQAGDTQYSVSIRGEFPRTFKLTSGTKQLFSDDQISQLATRLDQAPHSSASLQYHPTSSTEVLRVLKLDEVQRFLPKPNSFPIIKEFGCGPKGNFSLILPHLLKAQNSLTIAVDINPLYVESFIKTFKEESSRTHYLLAVEANHLKYSLRLATVAVANFHWDFLRPKQYLYTVAAHMDTAKTFILFTHNRFVPSILKLLQLKYGQKVSTFQTSSDFQTLRNKQHRNHTEKGTFIFFQPEKTTQNFKLHEAINSALELFESQKSLKKISREQNEDNPRPQSPPRPGRKNQPKPAPKSDKAEKPSTKPLPQAYSQLLASYRTVLPERIYKQLRQGPSMNYAVKDFAITDLVQIHSRKGNLSNSAAVKIFIHHLDYISKKFIEPGQARDDALKFALQDFESHYSTYSGHYALDSGIFLENAPVVRPPRIEEVVVPLRRPIPVANNVPNPIQQSDSTSTEQDGSSHHSTDSFPDNSRQQPQPQRLQPSQNQFHQAPNRQNVYRQASEFHDDLGFAELEEGKSQEQTVDAIDQDHHFQLESSPRFSPVSFAASPLRPFTSPENQNNTFNIGLQAFPRRLQLPTLTEVSEPEESYNFDPPQYPVLEDFIQQVQIAAPTALATQLSLPPISQPVQPIIVHQMVENPVNEDLKSQVSYLQELVTQLESSNDNLVSQFQRQLTETQQKNQQKCLQIHESCKKRLEEDRQQLELSYKEIIKSLQDDLVRVQQGFTSTPSDENNKMFALFVDEHDKELKKAHKRIADLEVTESRVNRLDLKIEELRQDREKNSQLIKSLQQQLLTQSQKLASAQADNSQLLSSQTDLQNDVRILSQSESDLKLSVKKLELELSNQRKIQPQPSSSSPVIEAHNGQLSTIRLEFEKKIKSLQTEVNSLTGKLNKKDLEILAFVSSTKDLKRQLHLAQEQLANSKKEIAVLQTQLSKEVDKSSQLLEDKAAVIRNLETLKGEHDSQILKIESEHQSELDSLKDLHFQEISKINSDHLTQSLAQIGQTSSKVVPKADQQALVQSLQKRNQEQCTSLVSLQNKQKELQGTITSLQAEVIKLKEERDKALIDNSKSQALVSQLDQSCIQLRSEIQNQVELYNSAVAIQQSVQLQRANQQASEEANLSPTKTSDGSIHYSVSSAMLHLICLKLRENISGFSCLRAIASDSLSLYDSESNKVIEIKFTKEQRLLLYKVLRESQYWITDIATFVSGFDTNYVAKILSPFYLSANEGLWLKTFIEVCIDEQPEIDYNPLSSFLLGDLAYRFQQDRLSRKQVFQHSDLDLKLFDLAFIQMHNLAVAISPPDEWEANKDNLIRQLNHFMSQSSFSDFYHATTQTCGGRPLNPIIFHFMLSFFSPRTIGFCIQLANKRPQFEHFCRYWALTPEFTVNLCNLGSLLMQAVIFDKDWSKALCSFKEGGINHNLHTEVIESNQVNTTALSLAFNNVNSVYHFNTSSKIDDRESALLVKCKVLAEVLPNYVTPLIDPYQGTSSIAFKAQMIIWFSMLCLFEIEPLDMDESSNTTIGVWNSPNPNWFNSQSLTLQNFVEAISPAFEQKFNEISQGQFSYDLGAALMLVSGDLSYRTKFNVNLPPLVSPFRLTSAQQLLVNWINVGKASNGLPTPYDELKAQVASYSQAIIKQ